MLRPSPSSGFTIAEVLVALGSIAVLLIGAVSLLLAASGSIRAARLSTTATTLAQQKVEQLRADSAFATGTGEDFLGVDGAPEQSSSAVFVRRWTVSQVPGTSDSFSVAVEVAAVGSGRVADVEAIFGQGDARWP